MRWTARGSNFGGRKKFFLSVAAQVGSGASPDSSTLGDRIKRQRRGVDHIPTLASRFSNEYSYISTPPPSFLWHVKGWSLYLLIKYYSAWWLLSCLLVLMLEENLSIVSCVTGKFRGDVRPHGRVTSKTHCLKIWWYENSVLWHIIHVQNKKKIISHIVKCKKNFGFTLQHSNK